MAYALGRERMRQGAYADAEALFAAAAAERDFRVGANAERARCLGLHLGRADEAIALLRSCEIACDDRERGLLLLVTAEIEVKRGNLAAAEDCAERIHRDIRDLDSGRGADQVLARVEVHRARELADTGHGDSALFALARARQRDPEWAEPLRLTGTIFEARQQPGRALRDYLAALRIDPRSSAAADVSRLLRDRREPAAEAGLAEAAERAPDCLPTARALAAHRLRIGDLEGAAHTLERCAEARPSDPQVWFELARAIGSSDPETAERALRRSLELAPEAPRPRRLLAELLLRSGRYLEAVALIEDSHAEGLEGPGGPRLH